MKKHYHSVYLKLIIHFLLMKHYEFQSKDCNQLYYSFQKISYHFKFILAINVYLAQIKKF